MFRTYQITSAQGIDLGTYAAADEAGALDAMARDAGYASQAAAAEAVGPFEGTVKAVATLHQIGKLREESFTAGDEVMGQICNLALDIGVVYDSLCERDADRLRGMSQEEARAECDRVIRGAS